MDAPRVVLAALLLCAPLPAAAAEASAGDRAWARRADALDGRLARPDAIERAIRAYADEVASSDALEPRWKLLRSLHYLSEFTTASESRRNEAVARAVELADAWSEEPTSASDRDRALLSFWSAIAWGARAGRVGLLTIVREGVANRIHDLAGSAIARAPDVERGGAYRLLSRLHASLPRVPFVSGWVDREQALPLAEKAMAVAPDDPGNQLILAMALAERAPDQRARTLSLLERVAALEPRPELLAEDLAIREQARERLADLAPERTDAGGGDA